MERIKTEPHRIGVCMGTGNTMMINLSEIVMVMDVEIIVDVSCETWSCQKKC